MKIPVTKTIDGKEWLCFEEEDVKKACRMEGCDEKMIDECIEAMKEEANDSICAYVTLCNELNCIPEYKPVEGREFPE